MAHVNKSNLDQNAALLSKNTCVVLVKTEWNAAIVDELENGCIRKLKEAGAGKIIRIIVPGAIEIPFAIKSYWEKTHRKKKIHAFVALACVIRGGTPHFDYVCKAITDGVVQLNLLLPVPTIFGVLTVNDQEQAMDRIGGKHGHKGEEAALTAAKMIRLNRKHGQD